MTKYDDILQKEGKDAARAYMAQLGRARKPWTEARRKARSSMMKEFWSRVKTEQANTDKEASKSQDSTKS